MVQVETSVGVVEGELVDNELGGQFYSFKGIPYAEPPLGDLRFKAPLPKTPWEGVLIAKECGPTSYQRDPLMGNISCGSEDCLYLNVYSPDVTPVSPLPVMVWIHGGAFIMGSGSESTYGPEFLVRHGVILVTLNYRLGLLGFLSLDTEDVPGNAGMKDQALALKWVKENITNFGGDSNNITIFGESAGGASVSYQLMSPMSKGLFNRAIVQSGCTINFWASTNEPREKAEKIARQLEFYSEDDKELYEFFKNLPLEKLVDIEAPVNLASKPYELEFAIVSERKFGDNERFFYGDLFDALRNGIHEGVDIMTGYTEDEGLLAFAKPTLKGDCLFKAANSYLEFFVPKPISLVCPIKEQLQIGKKIKKYYLKNGLNCKDSLDGFLQFLNLDFFVYSLISFAKFCANTKNNNVYLYKFTCKSERNQMANHFGAGGIIKDRTAVCHADDVAYLFPVKLLFRGIEQNPETLQLIDNVTTMWTNFAKYGNPTPDESLGVKWLPFDVQEQKFLEIGNKLVLDSAPEKEDVDLWDSIYKEYLPEHVA